ncbi:MULTISPECIES: zinc-ribbon domain-containing protein [Streptomyces]|uniref:zinc-ribbon domain-containing protein n=1 Tax=Streptomyces TaxID=1883 RepID=UPI0004C82900|nr:MULTISPECIES: zinc-ribbon domain-containing protein [Streptomyces]MCX4958874.1 zinc-ribbon domain-containing protein [Streptomyces virginiae]MCX5177700.1 zinc-ribbon domain-containing protein [Streptomyces virginiae]
MRRRTVTAGNLEEILQVTAPATAPEQAAAHPSAAAPAAREDHGLRTEFEFELPRGYVDEAGTVHRHGSMRLATARDELRPQIDLRVKENPAYLSVVLLSQVITRLGTITDVHAGIVERMYATDVAFLQDFYRRVNSEGHTRAAVTCPHCEGGFEVDLSGGRLGES